MFQITMTEAKRVDVNKLRNTADIATVYAAITKEEETIAKELDLVLDRQVDLDQRLAGINLLAPKLKEVGTDSEQLSRLISFTAGLAEKVSAKV